MKWLSIIAATALQQQDRTQVSPIQKVIQMLTDMQTKGQSDLDAEQVEWSKFKQFCTDTQQQKEESIEQQKQEIESLVAAVGEFTAKAEELARNAVQLNTDLGKNQEDLKAIRAERAKGHENYLAEHRDFSESVDALERALIVMKKQNYDRQQKQSFLQTDANLMAAIPEKARMLVESYIALKDDDDYLSRTGPEANAYEFQSGNIVQMLQKLSENFQKQVSDLEKAEMNAKHAAELAEEDLSNAIEQTRQQLSTTSQAAQEARANAAINNKSLDGARSTMAEDQQFLKDFKVECNHKQLSFTEKQKLRQDELEAIGKAVEILGQSAVGGAASKRAFLFLQENRPWALRVSEFLHKASEKFGDNELALMAQQSQKNPFGKVKKMIRNMIDRLLEEANAEAEKKGFCDKQLKVNEQNRKKLQGQYDTTVAELELTLATQQKLNEEIAQLRQDISFLDEARAKTNEARGVEKAQNKATIEEAQQAQIAVASARNVIADFYAKAGTATAFIQADAPGYGQGSEDTEDKGHVEGMQTFGDSYQGQQDSAGGVLSMLSVIASDFSNLQADTETAEAQAQAEFDKFMADTKRDKAVKSKQVENKTTDEQMAATRAHNLKQDVNGTDDELRAANRYFDQLKPQCLVKVSYEDRVRRREEEIESLKEALQILGTAAPVFLQIQ